MKDNSKLSVSMVRTLYTISCLLTLIQAMSVQKRDGSTMKEDLADLKVKMTALNTAIDSYKGGVFAAVPVQSV